MSPMPVPETVSVEAVNTSLCIGTNLPATGTPVNCGPAFSMGGGGLRSLLVGSEHGAREEVYVDLSPGTGLHLDVRGCTVNVMDGHVLADVEVFASSSALNLGRVEELSVVATGSDVQAHVVGPRLVARLTMAGMSVRLDRPRKVLLGGEPTVMALEWGPGAYAGADLTDKTRGSRVEHSHV